MAMWNRCAICGRAIPVGEPCYGVKDWRGDPIGGDTICRDCLVLENEPTLTQPNEPLTLEELREMDGEPVWCCPKNDPAKGSWMIVGPNGCENITSFAIYDDYGTGWLDYRRPPEGEA